MSRILIKKIKIGKIGRKFETEWSLFALINKEAIWKLKYIQWNKAKPIIVEINIKLRIRMTEYTPPFKKKN